MSISVLRSWEDADAPVLTRTIGSAIPLLKAVLVDGYGDKPGLGWELIWESATKLVVRNQGTRMFVRFEHSVSNIVNVKAYESMSDIDTGLFVCPDPDLEAAGKPFQFYFTHPSASAAAAIPWMVLGDAQGIWFGWKGGHAYYGPTNLSSLPWKFAYIGDYIAYDPTNTQYNFAMCQDAMSSLYWYGSWALSGNLDTVKEHYHIMRLPNQAPGALLIGMSSGHQYCTSKLGDQVAISKALDVVQHTSIPEIHAPDLLLGRLPGLKNSLSEEGEEGSAISTVALYEENKPELLFDYGDYKEHFFRYATANSSSLLSYFILTEGKGFRDVI